MGLQIIYGKAGSGKSTYLFQEMKKAYQQGKKVCLITPEQFSFTAEQKLLQELGEEALFGAEVLSFKRMAYRLMKNAKENRKRPFVQFRKSNANCLYPI